MSAPYENNDSPVVITRAELTMLLTQAAHDGAKQALADIGLEDKDAGQDLRDLRSFMRLVRLTKKTVFKSFLQQVTNFLFIVMLLGLGAKYGIKIMGE